jgi:hypothetical protein
MKLQRRFSLDIVEAGRTEHHNESHDNPERD